MNRTDYVDKMNLILSYNTKFKKMSDSDPFKISLKYELKINELTRKLKKKHCSIDTFTYQSLYNSGSGLGIMYGLPINQPLSCRH